MLLTLYIVQSKMSLTAEQIEAKTKLIEEYMAEIEIQLRTGLEIIDELKREGKPESEEFQNNIIEIIKKIEFCAASVESELEAEGSPTYYLANGRINIASDMPTFSITSANDSDSDESEDSDVSFTEEEREHIESDEHASYLKRYGLKPSAQFSFTITQDMDDISLSAIKTIVDNISTGLQTEQVLQEVDDDC